LIIIAPSHALLPRDQRAIDQESSPLPDRPGERSIIIALFTLSSDRPGARGDCWSLLSSGGDDRLPHDRVVSSQKVSTETLKNR
jgi:hypothetical protein